MKRTGWLNADAPFGGLGYHHSIGPTTDLLGEVAYRSADYDLARIDGARATVGVRAGLGERFEGYRKANY